MEVDFAPSRSLYGGRYRDIVLALVFIIVALFCEPFDFASDSVSDYMSWDVVFVQLRSGESDAVECSDADFSDKLLPL